MILDTGALSGWAEGYQSIKAALRHCARPIIPAVVLGEYRYGIRKSRYFSRYQDFLEQTLPLCQVQPVGEWTSELYGQLRFDLEKRGEPIPLNDIWIAAACLELGKPLLSNDSDFDRLEGLTRVGFALA